MSTFRIRASSENSTHSHTSLQSRVLGLGLGLALSLGMTAVPANADTLQDIQKAASGTTLGQTIQNITSDNPLEGLKRQTQSAADSTAQAASSSGPSLNLPEGPSVVGSLKDAFTTSPPQTASKGYGSAQPEAADDSQNRTLLTAGLVGGLVLLLGSSLLNKNKGKGAARAAAKTVSSSASRPVQKAKGLLGNARAGEMKSAARKTVRGVGSQLSGAKSAGTAKGSKAGGRASSAAQQAQEKVAGGGVPVAGLAAAGLVAVGVVLAVIPKPANAPIDTSAPQEALGSAVASAQDGAEAVKQQGSQGAVDNVSFPKEALDSAVGSAQDGAEAVQQKGSEAAQDAPAENVSFLQEALDSAVASAQDGAEAAKQQGPQAAVDNVSSPKEALDSAVGSAQDGAEAGKQQVTQAAQDTPVDNASFPKEALDSAVASAQDGTEAVKQQGSAAAQQVDVTNRVPSQEPQGDAFDLSLSDGTPGPNSEPLNLRPSVDQVDAPKSGGIPIFGPKGQQEAGATAAPKEEGNAQKSIVKPGGYEPKSQAAPGQDLSAVDPAASVTTLENKAESIVNPQSNESERSQAGQDVNFIDPAASVTQVASKAGDLGNGLASAFTSKGNPEQEQTTDQRLEPQGPAAQAQRSADEAALSKSDEQRVDRDT